MQEPAEEGPPRLSLFQVIGYNVKRLREARGWNQEELAVHSHTSRTTVAKVEAGAAVQTEKLRDVMDTLEEAWEVFTTRPSEDDSRVYLQAQVPTLELHAGQGLKVGGDSPLMVALNS